MKSITRYTLERRLVPLLRRTPAERVLELGAGRRTLRYGHLMPGARVTLCDLAATQRPDARADGARLPFRAGAFDAVLATELLEHVADPARIVREVWGVLRPGGTLWIAVPFAYPIHGWPADYWRFAEAGVRRLVSDFREVTVHPFGGPLGVAWEALGIWRARRALGILVPVVAGLERDDRRFPLGYVVKAVR